MKPIDVILILFMIGGLLLSIFKVLPWMVKRAANKILRTCREYKATNPKNAITMEQLQIRPRTLFTLRPRDFRVEALGMLLQAGIIQQTADNKYYLVEEKVVGTKLEQLQLYQR